jgi:hypothetical protein
MAPNANPSNCGGVSTSLCTGNRVPEVLKAAFSGVNTCGFSGDAYLPWDGSKWSIAGIGCQGGSTVSLDTLAGWRLTITGPAPCLFGTTLTSSVCDGPEGFKLVFSVTMNGPPPPMFCPCCANGTSFTITITNGLAPS